MPRKTTPKGRTAARHPLSDTTRRQGTPRRAPILPAGKDPARRPDQRRATRPPRFPGRQGGR